MAANEEHDARHRVRSLDKDPAARSDAAATLAETAVDRLVARRPINREIAETQAWIDRILPAARDVRDIAPPTVRRTPG